MELLDKIISNYERYIGDDIDNRKRLEDMRSDFKFHNEQVQHYRKKALDVQCEANKNKDKLSMSQSLCIERLQHYVERLEEFREVQERMLYEFFDCFLTRQQVEEGDGSQSPGSPNQRESPGSPNTAAADKS